MTSDDLVRQFTPPDLLPEQLPETPFALLDTWLDEAWRKSVAPNPHAMTLATVDGSGIPSARIVLCKKVDVDNGTLTFYTNYNSRKGRALEATGLAAAVFHWDVLGRQARIEGWVERTSDSDSDAYFASRPLASRIGAVASEQSAPIGSRGELLDRVERAMKRHGIEPGDEAADLPRPRHWGGYNLWARAVQLWVSGPGRVHECARWERKQDSPPGPWSATRVQP